MQITTRGLAVYCCFSDRKNVLLIMFFKLNVTHRYCQYLVSVSSVSYGYDGCLCARVGACLLSTRGSHEASVLQVSCTDSLLEEQFAVDSKRSTLVSQRCYKMAFKFGQVFSSCRCSGLAL